MKQSTTRQTDRGSVIVMAVGVLTMLFMLGATYLIVAIGDQREATSIAAAAPIRKIAVGVKTRVAARLVDDLYFNADPNASQYPFETATLYVHSLDYASETVDRWLSSANPEGGVWRHVTNLNTGPDPLDWHNNVPLRAYTGKPINLNGHWAVDTDGDHLTDSFLFYTHVTDERGNYYYAAVRVVDLCSMVNINTAYKPTDTVAYGQWAGLPAEPVRGNLLTDLNIEGLAGLGIGAAPLHEQRRGQGFGNLSIQAYNNRYVACALNQQPLLVAMPFRPFCMDDALALLWRENDASNTNYTVRGRLANVLGAGNLAAKRQFLTAWSSSRRLPIQVKNEGPDGNANYKHYPIGFSIDVNHAVTTDPNGKTALMRAYFNAIPPFAMGLTDGPFFPLNNAFMERRRMRVAAQLAANHVDFVDADGDITVINTNADGGPLKDDSDAPTVVFGIERQPFITELFLKKHREGETTVRTYSAIELYNPYASPVSLAGYKLKVGGNAPVGAPFPATLGAGGRLVIVSDQAKILVAAGAAVVHSPSLDLSQACRIVRQVTVGGGPKYVIMGSGSLDVADPPGVDGVDYKVAQRDDAPDRARYSVARYHTLEKSTDVQVGGSWHDYTPSTVPGGRTATATNLGLANDFVGNHLSAIAPAPVYVRNGGMVNLGDLYRLYVVGPTEEKGLDEVLEPAATLITNGRLNTVGGMSAYRWMGGNGMPYVGPDYGLVPPMPPSCMLSRYFTVNSPGHDGIDNDFDLRADDNGAGPYPADTDLERAIYGVINVNTAPKEVLMTLPFITDALADAIIAHRNSKPAPYSCLIGESELLWPLWQNAAVAKSDAYQPDAPNYKIGDNGSDDGLVAINGDMAKVQSRWARWSNLLTARSDSFAVYITVMRFPKTVTQSSDFSTPTAVKRYVSILDRSQCNKRGQPVMTLMFSEME